MKLVFFTCSKCGKNNEEIETNLLSGQTGKNSRGTAVPFNISRVLRECKSCVHIRETGVIS